MSSNLTASNTHNNITRDLVLTGLFIALIFISTYVLQFHLPISLNSGGLVHLGNTMLFSIAIVFGKRKAAVSGALGMALFDIVSQYAIWAPCTFIVRGLQGYIIGSIANRKDRNGKSFVWNLIAIIISSVWMIAGYFAYNIGLTILTQAPNTPWSAKWALALTNSVTSIPGDILQTIFGIVGALVLIPALHNIKKSILK